MKKNQNVISKIAGVQLSSAALAEVFDVTDRTIRNWRAEGMPESSSGKFNWRACFAWWLENINKPTSDKEEKARERYWQAKADREELAVKELLGSVLNKSDLETEWVRRVNEVNKGLDSVCKIFPDLVLGKSRREIKTAIEEYIRKLRENYAREGKFTPVSSRKKRKSAIEPTSSKKKTTKKKSAGKRKK